MAQPAPRPSPNRERPHHAAARRARLRVPRPANDNRRRGGLVPPYGFVVAAVLLATGLALILT